IKATCRRQFFTFSRLGSGSGDYCDRNTDVKSRSLSFATRIYFTNFIPAQAAVFHIFRPSTSQATFPAICVGVLAVNPNAG
ncbi:MAG: hypothetical protein LBB26_00905, partial [Puniceicoccales bacterium]|nr:hypothetical protein [Puniceicoccales bacterium]